MAATIHLFFVRETVKDRIYTNIPRKASQELRLITIPKHAIIRTKKIGDEHWVRVSEQYAEKAGLL